MSDSSAPAARATSIPETGQRIEVAYHGSVGPVARIAAANGFFSLLTLGFYRFWGKTRLRRYFWGHVSVGGDRLEYTGLAKELLIGFLIVIAVLIPVFLLDGALQIALGPESPWLWAEQVVYGLLFWFLINLALFRARRYRLTRTRWRGIRFRQTGKSVKYALMAMVWQFLTALSLGLAFPVYRMKMQAYLVENTGFGTEMFRFSGRGSELFKTWLVAWLLLPFSLGISYVWYRVQEYNYVMANVTATGFRAEADLKTGAVVKIFLMLLVLTIALMLFLAFLFAGSFMQLMPVAGEEDPTAAMGAFASVHFLMVIIGFLLFLVLRGVLAATFFLHPLLRLLCESTTFYGGNDLDAVLQAAASDISYGEGLADALDVGEF